MDIFTSQTSCAIYELPSCYVDSSETNYACAAIRNYVFSEIKQFCARVVVSKQRYILARGCYFRNNFMLKFVERMARLWYHQYEKVNMYEQVEMKKAE